MPAPIYLITEEHVALHTEKVGPHTHLVVEDHSRVATQFKASTHSTATTSIVATPPPGQAIVLTDLLISSEKKQGGGTGTITLQFEDGTNTVIIFVASVEDSPVNMGIPFAGRWRGWQDARFEMITSAATDSTVSIGYYFLSGKEQVLSFTDWDAQR